ncbi:MAG: hypothetical protein DMG73_11165 [Acidobacteria bacterium]|nr:MAG: hypothetical protein DMG73_11165 [Acidobacteriota bacterium]PYX65153.1 MAG: hypothetical protein DMG74_10130 [Acidobacteriota bacterium]
MSTLLQVVNLRKDKLTIACAEAVEDRNFLWKAPEKKEKMATAIKEIGETPEKNTSDGLAVGRHRRNHVQPHLRARMS